MSSRVRQRQKAPSRVPARRPRQPLRGELLDVDALTLDAANPRQRTARGRDLLVDTLKKYRAARSIVIDEQNVVIAGNGVADAAAEAGISKVRVIDADGDELIAVRRRNLTALQKRELAIADNRTAELAEWNGDHVIASRALGVDLRPFWTEEEEAAIVSNSAAAAVERMAGDGQDGGSDEPAASGDFQQFSCALTVEQERLVRGALRSARAIFKVDTTGNALTAALKQWHEDHGAVETPRRSRRG